MQNTSPSMSTGDHEEALIVNQLDVQLRAGKFLHMPALSRMKGLALGSRSIEDRAAAEQSFAVIDRLGETPVRHPV
jgi:hypothetical protein